CSRTSSFTRSNGPSGSGATRRNAVIVLAIGRKHTPAASGPPPTAETGKTIAATGARPEAAAETGRSFAAPAVQGRSRFRTSPFASLGRARRQRRPNGQVIRRSGGAGDGRQ